MTPKMLEHMTAVPPKPPVRDWPPCDVVFSSRRGRIQMKLSAKTHTLEFSTPDDAISFARKLWRAALQAKKENKA
jgi:hypothetical protein